MKDIQLTIKHAINPHSVELPYGCVVFYCPVAVWYMDGDNVEMAARKLREVRE